MRTYKSILEIKQANAANGYYWFSKDTLRFWGCRVHDRVYFGRYFTASSCDYYGNRYTRAYVVDHKGSVENIGEYGSKYSAIQSIKKHYRETEIKNLNHILAA